MSFGGVRAAEEMAAVPLLITGGLKTLCCTTMLTATVP